MNPLDLSLTQLARTLKDLNGEAIVIRGGAQPTLRRGDVLEPLTGMRAPSDRDLEAFFLSFVKPEKLRELTSKRKMDLALRLPEGGTFRVSLSLDGAHYACQVTVVQGAPPASGGGPVNGNGAAAAPAARSMPTPVPSTMPTPVPTAVPTPVATPVPTAGPPNGTANGQAKPRSLANGSVLPQLTADFVRPRKERPPIVPAAEPLLEEMMGTLIDRNGSDIHLKQGRVPVLRIDGELVPFGSTPLDEAMLWSLATLVTHEHELKLLDTDLQLDTAFAFKDRARFRTNVYTDINGLGIALRTIPRRIPSWKDLGLPRTARELVYKGRGLFLVTGPTGSGKSTTLASLIRDLNEHEYKHVITIEDPIEFVYDDDRCSITQREVPLDTPSFARGVIDAMRQDPDIVLVGEMRNLETMEATLTAAEAGKLVMATVHTTSAYQTVERILNAFPAESQSQARFQLASTIVGILSQTLLPKRGGGRVAAIELMVANDAVRASIRDAKPFHIQSVIETGAAQGMRSLDQHLLELLESGLVTYDNAFEKCQNPITFVKVAAKYQRGEGL